MRYPKGYTITTPRPSIVKRTIDDEIFYEANVRRANGKRTYLRRYKTHAEALAVCLQHIETGEKPARSGGRHNDRPVNARKAYKARSQGSGAGKETPAAAVVEAPVRRPDRIAMMRMVLRRLG